jgi:hypothetical protein
VAFVNFIEQEATEETEALFSLLPPVQLFQLNLAIKQNAAKLAGETGFGDCTKPVD